MTATLEQARLALARNTHEELSKTYTMGPPDPDGAFLIPFIGGRVLVLFIPIPNEKG